MAVSASEKENARQLAAQRVDFFVRRFEPSYRILAQYAALPLVLTPELVNYLRSRFLRAEHVPWIAEADLLLSDLCHPVGYEQYAMDSAVRGYLVEELQCHASQEKLEAVAWLLIRYIRQLEKSNPYLTHEELQSQQWAAMVFVESERPRVVDQIAGAYRDSIEEADRANGMGLASQAEMIRLFRITQKLAPQIQEYPGLLAYAELVRRAIANPESVAPEVFDRSHRVSANMELSLPQNLRPFRDFPPLVSFDYDTPILEFEDSDLSDDIGLTPETVSVEVATLTIVSSISEQEAQRVLEEKLTEIKERIAQDFQEQAISFRVEQDPKNVWMERLDEDDIELSHNHEPEVEVLEQTHLSIENDRALAHLSVVIRYAVRVRTFDVDSLNANPDADEESPLYRYVDWLNQETNGRVQVGLAFPDDETDEMNEVEVDLVELEIDQPIWVRKTYDIDYDVENEPTPSFDELEPFLAGETEDAETFPALESFPITIATLEEQEEQWEVVYQESQAHRYIESLPGDITLELIAIPAGEFFMGSPSDEPGRYDDESPQHQVTLSGFFMGRYPITQAQWSAVAALPKVDRDLEADPSRFKGEDRPVERVSWYEAVEFCARLSAYTGRTYRLPSEAE